MIRTDSAKQEFGRLGTTYADAIFATFYSYLTTFICHIKANSPGCQCNKDICGLHGEQLTKGSASF